MKPELMFIYGPPASGKLTVAEELTKITGYRVFHNHLTADLVASIFDFGTKNFTSLVHKYRLELIEAAMKAGVSIIFTYVYAKPHDDAFVHKIVKSVKRHGGSVHFIQLCCEKPQLIKRLKHPRRQRYSKIKNLKVLKGVMKKYDLTASVPYSDSFEIDNTNLSPQRVAHMIKNHYHLKKQTV